MQFEPKIFVTKIVEELKKSWAGIKSLLTIVYFKNFSHFFQYEKKELE